MRRYKGSAGAGIPNNTRRKVYKRDGYQCALCGCHDTLQIHHAIPRGEGGSDFPDNLITLCSKCHAQAHGIDVYTTRRRNAQGAVMVDGYPTQEEVELEIVRYLADMYTTDEEKWYPFK